VRALPQTPESANIRALSQILRERFTGLTGTGTGSLTVKLTLQHIPVTTQHHDLTVSVAAAQVAEGLEHVYRNGVLLDPSTYTIQGNVVTITLGTAGVAGDVYIVHYPYRTGV